MAAEHNALDEGRGWIFGQLTSVGVAVSVLLAEHPKRNRLLQLISEQLDQLADGTDSASVRAGIDIARRMYIPPQLKPKADDGP